MMHLILLMSFYCHSLCYQVKSDSLGISNKMYLKVDVEGGKVYFKKSKDGPEDKYFVHNKSMPNHFITDIAYLFEFDKLV